MSTYTNGSDIREIDADLMAAWIAAGNPKANGWTLIPDKPGPGYTWDGTQWVAPPPYIPQAVTKRQAILALDAAGMLASLDAAIAAAPPLVQRVWEATAIVERTDPMLAQMQPVLGWTDAQLDDLFTAAAQL